MAGEPLMKRQEADVTDAPKLPKNIYDKTLPTSSDGEILFNGADAFEADKNEDSSTKKTEEEASQNDEEQNGEPEN